MVEFRQRTTAATATATTAVTPAATTATANAEATGATSAAIKAATSAATTSSEISSSGGTPSNSRRPRYQHAIVTCESCKRGWLNAAGTQSLLSPEELACARCDSEDIGVADAAEPARKREKPSRAVRKRSKIPPAVRRRVLARDGHMCRAPGCRSTNIDVHHLVPQECGGSHDESNLLTLCEGHHRAAHSRKLIVRGTAPNVTFEFATMEPANRFAIESRAIETQRALERLGFKRHEAVAAVRAARTHVSTNDQPNEVWLKAALEQARQTSSRTSGHSYPRGYNGPADLLVAPRTLLPRQSSSRIERHSQALAPTWVQRKARETTARRSCP